MALTRTSFLAVVLLGLALPSVAHAERSLDEHRYFRALSIDLAGRIPTRAEIASFEASSFDLDAWIDQRLTGPAYAERLQRIYMDALRLEVNEAFTFTPPTVMLRRYPIEVLEADGSKTWEWVYWRSRQKRADATKSNKFCFDQADTGYVYDRARAPVLAPGVTAGKPVPRATFEARTGKVRPWWLYRDFRAAAPKQHYDAWKASEPRFLLGLGTERVPPLELLHTDTRLTVEPDGAPTMDVYTCLEESHAAESVTASIRGQNVTISCTTDYGPLYSSDCGCGKGLEWCMPGAGFSNQPAAFAVSTVAPFGGAEPFEVARRPQAEWFRLAWTEESRRFLKAIFSEDRDVREMLTARYSYVNGPLAHFYRAGAAADVAEQLALAPAGTVAYTNPKHLFEPAKLPADLLPHEMDRWVEVPDRGPRAAGILTQPAFLAKFASRRGRANAVYNAFLCREFVAENVKLEPSEQPNLMIRPGCATCHAKLEPLSAYFARTKESSFSWIDVPIDNPVCKVGPGVTPPPACRRYYDSAFSNATSGQLRGAYGSPANVELGPAGLAAEVVKSPEFSSCVARTVGESLLGRRMTSSDDAMLAELDKTLVDGGHRVRALVRAIVKSNAYRNVNAGGAR